MENRLKKKLLDLGREAIHHNIIQSAPRKLISDVSIFTFFSSK